MGSTSGSGWKTALQACSLTEAGGRSAGVGVAVRRHMGLGPALADIVGACAEMRPRLTMHHWVAVCRGGVGLGACYLVSGCGVTNRRNQDLLQEAADQIRAWRGLGSSEVTSIAHRPS